MRLTALSHVLAGELSVEDAAAHLRVSTRQVTRLLERLFDGGPEALGAANLDLTATPDEPAPPVEEPLRLPHRPHADHP